MMLYFATQTLYPSILLSEIEMGIYQIGNEDIRACNIVIIVELPVIVKIII